jgi:pimeloyl-ACP methyl ester carboxylesterase
MRLPVAWTLGLAGLWIWCGMGAAGATGQTASSPRPGVVFVVGGVGGLDGLGPAAQWILPRSGVPHEVRNFVWTHGWGKVFKDLQDTRYLLAQADELAEEIRFLKQKAPERPVYLVGKSGGAGLVLAAAGQLPPRTLERVVLLSAAVSPTFDLRPALRATKEEIVSYYSSYDWFVLGWGTSQFGTVDRMYGASAGWTGFVVPTNLSNEDRALYDRLEQIPWRPSMILEGNWGMHLGTSMPGFVGQEVAPWLKR